MLVRQIDYAFMCSVAVSSDMRASSIHVIYLRLQLERTPHKDIIQKRHNIMLVDWDTVIDIVKKDYPQCGSASVDILIAALQANLQSNEKLSQEGSSGDQATNKVVDNSGFTVIGRKIRELLVDAFDLYAENFDDLNQSDTHSIALWICRIKTINSS